MRSSSRSIGSRLRSLRPESRAGVLWRVAAALAAAALGVILFLTGPGSMQVLERAPAPGIAAPPLPAWAHPCVIDTPPPPGPDMLAFCSRVQGRVIAFETEHPSGERHVLLTGGFHLTLVELPAGAKEPSWGSTVTAVGPLHRASHGVRELIALSLRG